MGFMLEEPFCLSIILVDGHHSEILLFSIFHTKRTPTFRVNIFITLERFSDSVKFKGRLSITLEKPSEDG